MSTKKLSQKDVELVVSGNGYKLLSIYINSRTEIKVQCDKGHIFYTKLANIKKSKCACKACREMDAIDNARELFANKGFKTPLINEEYKCNTSKISCICTNDHSFELSLTDLQRGVGCSQCHIDSRRHNITYISEYISEFGYELLSKEYKNVSTTLTIKCANNHIFKMDFDHFRRGQRCKECVGIRDFNFENVKDVITDSGSNYILLDVFKRQDAHRKDRHYITLKCDNNHIYTTSFYSFKNGSRCHTCANNNKSDKFSLEYEDVRNRIENLGYVLLSDQYSNAKTKMEILCNNNHVFYDTWDNLKSNPSCPICRTLDRVDTSVKEYLRECINEWKLESAENCGYLCILTGEKFHHIHHLHSFNKIINETFDKFDDYHNTKLNEIDQHELIKIVNYFLKIHNRYPLGVCLHEQLHTLFHQTFGYGDNTPEQFNEFKTRLKEGEFNYFLEENNLKLVI